MCDIYNQCLRTWYTHTTWKHAEIIPVPINSKPPILNDYRPIALTPIITKCLEHLINKGRLVSNLKLDEYQFAYKKRMNTKYACLALEHCIRKHLAQKAILEFYFWIFLLLSIQFYLILFSSPFEEARFTELFRQLCFLIDRKQHVKIDDAKF